MDGIRREHMPRVSNEQAQRNRLAITEASARLFRERGIKGVSVSDLMAAAGLTHRGFYGHFESKNTLAGEACIKAFEKSTERWKKRMVGKNDRAAAMTPLAGGYLSARSRNSPGTACPAAALAIDVARESADSPVRAVYLAGVEQMIETLCSVQQTGRADIDRRQALAGLSTMAGALILACATGGNAISDELLAAPREQLTQPSSTHLGKSSRSTAA